MCSPRSKVNGTTADWNNWCNNEFGDNFSEGGVGDTGASY